MLLKRIIIYICLVCTHIMIISLKGMQQPSLPQIIKCIKKINKDIMEINLPSIDNEMTLASARGILLNSLSIFKNKIFQENHNNYDDFCHNINLYTPQKNNSIIALTFYKKNLNLLKKYFAAHA